MEQLSPEDIQEMDFDELSEYLDRAKESDSDTIDYIETLQHWLRGRVSELRDESYEVPEVFDTGAKITVKFITGNETITEASVRSGDITAVDGHTLTIDTDRDGPDYTIDTDEMVVTAGESHTRYDLVEVQLVSPPWIDPSDRVATGVTMYMHASGLSYVRRPPFVYPPEEFYEEHEYLSPNGNTSH